MEKGNKSTINRPHGERPLDATVLAVDIPGYIEMLKNEDAWQKNERNAITIAKTDDITITIIGLHKGADIKPGNDQARRIITLQVLEGSLQLDVTGKDLLELDRGHLATMHEYTPFTAIAKEETFCLLTTVA